MRADLKMAFEAEMALARSAYAAGTLDLAFHHLERAHILGQRHTLPHVVSHLWMLRVGLRRLDAREIAGQLLRIVAAALFSRIWVPVGNTGGANVSALRPMPVPEDLRQRLTE
ncbi:MAG: DUF3703 domain-containing protein [Burkholderiales bacterium]